MNKPVNTNPWRITGTYGDDDAHLDGVATRSTTTLTTMEIILC